MKRKDIEKILSDEAQKLEGDFGQILARISSPESRARSGEVQAVALTHRRRNAAIAAAWIIKAPVSPFCPRRIRRNISRAE